MDYEFAGYSFLLLGVVLTSIMLIVIWKISDSIYSVIFLLFAILFIILAIYLIAQNQPPLETNPKDFQYLRQLKDYQKNKVKREQLIKRRDRNMDERIKIAAKLRGVDLTLVNDPEEAEILDYFEALPSRPKS